MQSIEHRLNALETKAHSLDTSLKLILVQDGETSADALKRAGYPPDTANVACVVFVSPTDQRL